MRRRKVVMGPSVNLTHVRGGRGGGYRRLLNINRLRVCKKRR